MNLFRKWPGLLTGALVPRLGRCRPPGSPFWYGEKSCMRWLAFAGYETGWLPLLVLVGALTSGCLFPRSDVNSDFTLPLPQPGVTTRCSGGNERVLIVSPFVDKRAEQRIGMRKNHTDKDDVGSVFANHNVKEWLSSRLSNELNSAGFRVNPQGVHPNATTIQGFINDLFIEWVTHWSIVDVESDISVLIHVSRPDGLEAERLYFVKGVEQVSPFASQAAYAASLRKSSDDLMKRVVAGSIDLLNRYPETPVWP